MIFSPNLDMKSTKMDDFNQIPTNHIELEKEYRYIPLVFNNIYLI